MKLSKKYGGLQFFAGTTGTVIFNFDTHIKKITSADGTTWTTSGEMNDISDSQLRVEGETSGPVFTIEFDSGYIINTCEPSSYSSIVSDTTIGITSFATYTITSKAAVASKSYDLSTSTKWSSLSDGEHTVTLRAKASNYGTSNASNSVTVMKGSASYTLEAGTYKWVDSPNIDQRFVEYTEVLIQFSSYGNEYGALTIWLDGEIGLLTYVENGEASNTYFSDSGWVFNNYKTITLSTPQTVSAEFYEWAITGGNLVKQESETWVLNTFLNNSAVDFSVDIVSNGVNYSRIDRNYLSLAGEVLENNLNYYEPQTEVYNNDSWTNTAYRTITFSTPPSGDLLTWLQANGTKQGGE